MGEVSGVDSAPGQAQLMLLARMMDLQRTAGASIVAMMTPPRQAPGAPKVATTGTDVYL